MVLFNVPSWCNQSFVQNKTVLDRNFNSPQTKMCLSQDSGSSRCENLISEFDISSFSSSPRNPPPTKALWLFHHFPRRWPPFWPIPGKLRLMSLKKGGEEGHALNKLPMPFMSIFEKEFLYPKLVNILSSEMWKQMFIPNLGVPAFQQNTWKRFSWYAMLFCCGESPPLFSNFPRILERPENGAHKQSPRKLCTPKVWKKIHETVVSMGIYLRTLPNSKVHLSS